MLTNQYLGISVPGPYEKEGNMAASPVCGSWTNKKESTCCDIQWVRRAASVSAGSSIVTVGEIVRPFEIWAFLYGAQAVSKLRRGSAAWSSLCCWYSVNRWWHRPYSLAWEAKIFPFPPACFGATIKLLVIEHDLLTPLYNYIPSFLLWHSREPLWWLTSLFHNLPVRYPKLGSNLLHEPEPQPWTSASTSSELEWQVRNSTPGLCSSRVQTQALCNRWAS